MLNTSRASVNFPLKIHLRRPLDKLDLQVANFFYNKSEDETKKQL